MNNRVLFIINKYSGTGFQEAIEGKIIDACAKLNLECTIEYTQKKGHATELAHMAVTEGFERVFAMGGDGTVNEVAQALVHTPVAMGIIPKGSGNGLARHLQIPLRTSLALKLLGPHRILNMDTMQINDRLSVNVSGIGFDAHIAGKFGKNGKRGLMGYGKLVVKEFMRFKEFPANVSLDGKILKRKSFILALANSSQFGNNAKVSPHASVCDELIDVCFIKKVSAVQALPFIQRMFSGRLDHSAFVEILQAKKIELKFEKALPYHIDGESLEPEMNFKISLDPGSLKMIVPLKTKRKP